MFSCVDEAPRGWEMLRAAAAATQAVAVPCGAAGAAVSFAAAGAAAHDIVLDQLTRANISIIIITTRKTQSIKVVLF
jgi:hypothetical protein